VRNVGKNVITEFVKDETSGKASSDFENRRKKLSMVSRVFNLKILADESTEATYFVIFCISGSVALIIRIFAILFFPFL